VKPFSTILLSTTLVSLAVVAAAAGCGGDESDLPGAAGPDGAGSPGATAMHGDMVAPAATDVETIQSALGGGGPEPKVFYLRYADGTETHNGNYDACAGAGAAKVPKFECSFAPTLVECQRQIQAYLDAWYADFNIIFTLTRPTSGKYYTEVVSSGGGAWCKVDDKVAGVAPFLCKDLQGGVAYTFQGGRTARETAVIIAQEQAHLLGLEHTVDPHDIMFPTISADTMGFVDADSGVTGDRCDRDKQNSYKMMKKALGEWPGGPKPSVFGCVEDKQDPSVRFLTPSAGAANGHDFSVKVDVRDDCDVKKVEIKVMPQGLSAVAMAAPYEWDLTGINGAQTITVTATDASGRIGQASLEVTAPEGRQELGPDEEPGAGCNVASGGFGAAGAVPSLAMLLLFSRSNRHSRRRKVSGALSRYDGPSP
jgi:hypothetical protein